MFEMNQVSIVWQVWSVMLLGAVVMGLGMFVGIEWPWIKTSTRRAAADVCAWAVTVWRELFTDADVHEDARFTPPVQRHQDADVILIATRHGVYRAPHGHDAERRRQLLALAESSPFRKTVH